MHTAQVLGYPLLLISALELFLGFLLLKQNPRNSSANKATAACAFAAAIWSLSAGLMYVRISLGLDYLLFARFSWIGWFTVPTALQTVLYLRDERNRKARTAGMVLYPFWAAVLALCLFTDLIVTPGFVPIPYTNHPGPLEMPLRLTGSMMAFWLIYEIIKLRRQVTGFRRAQLSYYLYGTVIFGTGGAVVGGLLQVFTGRGLEPSLSAYFSLPWVLMIFYAITRHRLFDIRFIISRTLIILVLSFCISAFQFVLFKVLEPVIGPIATIFISVPIVGVIFFGTPLSRIVQQWINDLVLKGRYQYQKMLKESAGAMVTILDRDDLLRFIVDTVRSGLGAREVFLYLRGPDNSYSLRHCKGVNQETADGCVLPDNVAACLSAAGEPVISDELAAGSSGVDTGLMESIRRMGVEVILPLISKGQLLGVLTLNERSNGEPYLQGDIDALQTLASQAAVAIENTRLFEEAVQARALQKESEDIFRTLAETSNAAILIFRPDEVIYANPALTRMSGFAVHELQDMGPFALVHADFRELVAKRGEARLRGENAPSQYEFKYIHRDGSERWAITSSARLTLRGSPALLSTMVDITDLKKAEEAKVHFFKESAKHYQEKIAEQERFSAVLSTTSDGFWIVNEEARIVFVNDAYCAMTGYSRDELMAMTIDDVEARESPDIVRQHVDRIRREGHDRFETRQRRKDGTLIDLEVSVNRYKDGGIIFAFLRDISERKRAAEETVRLSRERERDLRERLAEQERFHSILANAKEGFWITSEQNRFLFVNDAYCRMMGWDREVLMQKAISDVEVSMTPEMVAQSTSTIREKGHAIFETQHQRSDGTPVDLEVSVTFYPPERVFFSFFRDIRERKRAAEEQLRLAAEKENILKDLHDGIGGITTNVNLLAELAQQSDDIVSIKRSLATIAALSRDSLSEIRSFIQSLDTKELSWQAIAAEFRSLGNTIVVPHGIAFSLDAQVAEGAGGPTSAISMNLFRVYKESLSNIIKHAKARSVDVRFSIEAGRVSLEVRDNGIGLDGKRGSGRGLMNMQNRAREMGGSLELTNDNGTRLRLAFPIP